MNNNKSEAIKKAVAISILILLIIVVGFIMIKYEIEGETNMPFKLTKIMIISTADGISKNDETISVTQCNDLYLSIEKNTENDDTSMIKNVYIENIKVMSEPQKGIVQFYRPSTEGKTVYVYEDELLIEDTITYSGDGQTSLQNLTISNQGGTISFRSCVREIGEIIIEAEADKKEVSYINDGTLLQRAGIEISEIRYNMGFDVIIELTDGKMYKGYVNMSLPIEDVEKEGVQGVEKVDLDDIVFKRIKIK